ncbi:hypothetical protein [Nocardioides zeicaulis]|uniref:Uncharacterized protein n=1 Tax=Nocardioides zeicaulis TaxID=1776857 RepID=A0ABV6E136_9ACTN
MRTSTLGCLASATVLALLSPLAPAPATASAAATSAGSTDWRTQACRDAGSESSGTPSRATLLEGRVRGLRSLTVTAERLTWGDGVRCDLVSVDGRPPFGRDLPSYGAEVAEMGTLVVGGVDQGETEHQRVSMGVGSSAGPAGSTSPRDVDHEVLGAVVYSPSESGTFPSPSDLPAAWQGQPYSFTHTRTTIVATFHARAGVRKTFTVTPATRAAAARRLERDLGAATSAADRRDARRTYRLALHGVRLVMKPFTTRWKGELVG